MGTGGYHLGIWHGIWRMVDITGVRSRKVMNRLCASSTLKSWILCMSSAYVPSSPSLNYAFSSPKMSVHSKARYPIVTQHPFANQRLGPKVVFVWGTAPRYESIQYILHLHPLPAEGRMTARHLQHHPRNTVSNIGAINHLRRIPHRNVASTIGS
jgi:hypothetical protein